MENLKIDLIKISPDLEKEEFRKKSLISLHKEMEYIKSRYLDGCCFNENACYVGTNASNGYGLLCDIQEQILDLITK